MQHFATFPAWTGKHVKGDGRGHVDTLLDSLGTAAGQPLRVPDPRAAAGRHLIMLRQDTSDSSIASYWPDTEGSADSLEDRIREKASTYDGKMPGSVRELTDTLFLILKAALLDADWKELERRAASREDEEVTIRLLELMSRDTDRHYRMRALCLLRLMGREGRSFQTLGDLLGTRRATVHKCYRQLQARLGDLRGRGDKSPEAREKYRRRRIGQTRDRGDSDFAGAWAGTLRQIFLPPPPVAAAA